MKERLCIDCKYCLECDYGYSNYTVEGTNVYCMFDLNPGLPEDKGWGEEPALKHAKDCTRFTPGGSTVIDVDRDKCRLVVRPGDIWEWEPSLGEAYSDDPEMQAFINKVISE
jgi:hypothetical protein